MPRTSLASPTFVLGRADGQQRRVAHTEQRDDDLETGKRGVRFGTHTLIHVPVRFTNLKKQLPVGIKHTSASVPDVRFMLHKPFPLHVRAHER